MGLDVRTPIVHGGGKCGTIPRLMANENGIVRDETRSAEADQPVFASVKYANAAPLAHFLTEVAPGVGVITGRPAELAAWLADGWADAAMVPVADLFADHELVMIDGVGICADGEVGSVLLKCNCPPAQVRTVARDVASRTSNALAEILLARHLHLSVEMVPAETADADARVVIGDRAMKAPSAPGGDLDLAGLWKDMTGLPFVFAVWAYRKGHPQAEALSRIARAARDEGVRAAGELGEFHARRLGLDAQRVRDYLTHVVHYHVGPREIEAMDLFRTLIDKQGGRR